MIRKIAFNLKILRWMYPVEIFFQLKKEKVGESFSKVSMTPK